MTIHEQNAIPVGTRVSRVLYQKLIARSERLRAQHGVRLSVSSTVRAILEKALEGERLPRKRGGK